MKRELYFTHFKIEQNAKLSTKVSTPSLNKLIMNDFITNMVSTNSGWVQRQILKYTAMGAAIATTWLVSHGLDAVNATTLATGLAAGVAGVAELLLSKAASKIAAK